MNYKFLGLIFTILISSVSLNSVFAVAPGQSVQVSDASSNIQNLVNFGGTTVTWFDKSGNHITPNCGTIIPNSARTFATTLCGGSVLANETLNIPVLNATDTAVVLGLAQTFSHPITFSQGVVLSGTISGTYNIGGTPSLISTLTVSNANIALQGNSLTTSIYAIKDTFPSTLPESILIQPSSGTHSSQLALAPSGSGTSVSRLTLFGTAGIGGVVNGVTLGSNFTTSEFGLNVFNSGSSASIRPFDFLMNGTKELSLDTASTITTYVPLNGLVLGNKMKFDTNGITGGNTETFTDTPCTQPTHPVYLPISLNNGTTFYLAACK